jgi:ABC-2 type transport system permease protein
MSPPSDLAPDAAPPEAPQAAPARAVRPFYWSVRREIWESRSIYVVPLIASGVVMIGFLLGLMAMAHSDNPLAALDPTGSQSDLWHGYALAASIIILTAMIVGLFYSLGALNNERRDRSILFWKSLPVSDLTTVLAKASIPFVVLPVVAFAVTLATQIVMLLINTVAVAAHGLSVAALWGGVPVLEKALVMLYGLIAVSLWFAPVWAWLLLVSGWAKRAPFLWAFLPPIALCVIEAIAFNTSHFAGLLGDRLTGGYGAAFTIQPAPLGVSHLDLADMDPLKFLTTPGLWGGLALAAGFLAAAVWQRRRKEAL